MPCFFCLTFLFLAKIGVCHNGHTLIFCICNQLLGRTKYKYVPTH
nr:MAG TPA: hypothetical protein [Caudoviricetes sp.]